jgi:hypothetical protein
MRFRNPAMRAHGISGVPILQLVRQALRGFRDGVQAVEPGVERVLVGQETLPSTGRRSPDSLGGVEDVLQVVAIVPVARSQSPTASRSTRRVKSESCRAVTTCTGRRGPGRGRSRAAHRAGRAPARAAARPSAGRRGDLAAPGRRRPRILPPRPAGWPRPAHALAAGTHRSDRRRARRRRAQPRGPGPLRLPRGQRQTRDTRATYSRGG